MAHMTKVNGTAYQVNGGRTKVDGTSYKIASGRTKVDGTAYAINFGATWAKYSATATTEYVRGAEETTTVRLNSASNYIIYESFTFTPSSGIAGYNQKGTKKGTDLTGYCYVKNKTEAYFLESVSSTNSTYTTYNCTKYPAELVSVYTKGSTSYGVVETAAGDIPDGGELVYGSIADGACAVKVGSTVYWYERQ